MNCVQDVSLLALTLLHAARTPPRNQDMSPIVELMAMELE